MAVSDAEELTIDELARRTGTTARNVRAYQSRGLLSAPAIRGRTGYYGPEHVARLELIQAMQAEGFRLEAIGRVIRRPAGAAEQMFAFGRALLGAFGEPAPEFATAAELERRLGGPIDPRLVRKAERLGLIRRLDDGSWEILSPTLVSAGEELSRLGVPISHALAVAEQITRHTRAIARSYVRLFMTDVVAEGAEDWDRLSDALERLRPLAMEAISASFEQAMSDLVELELKKAMHG